ncbi:MAG: type VII secretion protein EssC [Bacillus sp. (in: firmicutes)]
MKYLWVFQESSFQQIPLKNGEKVLTVGMDMSDMIKLADFPLPKGQLQLKRSDEGESWEIFEATAKIGVLRHNHPFIYEQGNDTLFFLIGELRTQRHYYIGARPEVRFNHEISDGHLVSEAIHPFLKSPPLSLMKNEQEWTAVPELEGSRVYLNGSRLTEPCRLEDGDTLFWQGLYCTLAEGDVLSVSADSDYQTSLTETALPVSEMKLKYPIFQRTPRMIYELPQDKVNLSFPGQDPEDDNRGLWLVILPPLVMLIVMGVVAMINPRGIFMLISVAMFTTTIFTSTIQYFRDKKRVKQRKERRFRIYNRYLEDKREELDDLYRKQQEVMFYHNPSFEEMKNFVSNISERIWERAFEHEDFLHLRIGKADVDSSYTINLNSSDMSNREIDGLLEDSQQLREFYKKVKNVPLAIQLSSGSIGLVGKHSIVMNELHQLIGQLVFFHSYHDIRLVAIFKEEEYEQWKWMKWLPHFQLPYSYAKGFIYNESTRDQLLTSIYQSVRERDLDEDKDKKRFLPHFVFIVSDRNLIAEHVIMEYLEGKHTNVGISTIFVSDTKENLTENLHTLVQYINDREGEILIENRKAVHTPFTLDTYTSEGNERFARTLGSLKHMVGMNNSIPELVTFLQMFDTRDVNDLRIEEKWLSNQSSDSLSVPIGLKGKTDKVILNLHEKAHGPHGLVAGTTGSGKSELLQTYILSMAVHFHPHEVAFLLIDYKGGGMALPFKNMPHLLGTITNIEGSRNFSNRALASINSELKKRQRLFGAHNVNHIDDYTELYKQGTAKTALPHLFLICDEFAELKNEEPEFIKELVSAARIGRSLGVHLILATQKPGGVIDNQIWSNARFRIALKVQDENDSREILKNGDAANITATGRGYLQVGNNELYELFQSAWSGAPYAVDTFAGEDEVALITDLGLVQLSDVKAEPKAKLDKKSEIEVVVDQIQSVQQRLGIKKLPSPWLPPLEERLYVEGPISQDGKQFEIALKDEPEKQLQSHYAYQWIHDGSIIIFGSSGYGKSTTAMTLLLQFAKAYSPKDLHYYIFDFGNGTLLPLKPLRHTADYFRIDEERKIDKFLAFMKREIDDRKQLFAEKEVSSFSLFNEIYPDEKIPLLFIVIDNYDLVKEEMFDSEAVFTQFARDGQSLGIYFILTATRVNAIRQPLMNNFRTKIFHYLIDSSEIYGVLGRPQFEQEPVPGRAMIRKEETYFAQMYLPVEGDNDLEILQAVKETVASLNERYADCKQPNPIPMLPAALALPSFEQRLIPFDQKQAVPIGLCEETVEPVFVELVDSPNVLVMGQFRKGKSNALKVMLHMLAKNPEVIIGLSDGVDRSLSGFQDYESIDYLRNKDEIAGWMAKVGSLMKEREDLHMESMQQGRDMPVFEKVVLVIDGYARFQQQSDPKLQDAIAGFMKQYSYLGFSVIVSGNANEFSKGFDSLTTELKQIRQGLLLMKKSDQNIFTLPFTRNEKEIQPGYGYYVENGKERFIQIPHYLKERGE